MQNPTIAQLRALMESTQRPCVSLYMPTHPGVAENQQDRTRFKNLLRQAEKSLETLQLRSPAIKQLLAPAAQLGSDGLFWRQQNHGLAVFLSPEHFSYYQLPAEVTELCMVTDRFHVKPLLSFFSHDQFYVLAFSLKGVRLLLGTQHGLSALPVEAPMTMEEFLVGEEHEPSLQFRTFSTRGMGRQMSTFHGHGGGDEDMKDDIIRYCRYVDGLVSERLRGEDIPLVLTGVNYLLPMYREVNTYPHLADVQIEGNPDEFGAAQLHRRTWAAIEPQLVAEQERELGRFQELLGTGKASTDVREVALAAHHGRVEVLFVPRGVQQPGILDLENGRVELLTAAATGQYPDVLDRTAIGVLATGGTVYVVDPADMPQQEVIAAIYRY